VARSGYDDRDESGKGSCVAGVLQLAYAPSSGADLDDASESLFGSYMSEGIGTMLLAVCERVRAAG